MFWGGLCQAQGRPLLAPLFYRLAIRPPCFLCARVPCGGRVGRVACDDITILMCACVRVARSCGPCGVLKIRDARDDGRRTLTAVLNERERVIHVYRRARLREGYRKRGLCLSEQCLNLTCDVFPNPPLLRDCDVGRGLSLVRAGRMKFDPVSSPSCRAAPTQSALWQPPAQTQTAR